MNDNIYNNRVNESAADRNVDNAYVDDTAIDDHHDAKVGAELGGTGGVIVGALAGSMAGPVGAVIGAVIGGAAGAVGSGAAVEAVDRRDNDGHPLQDREHENRVAADEEYDSRYASDGTMNNPAVYNNDPTVYNANRNINPGIDDNNYSTTTGSYVSPGVRHDMNAPVDNTVANYNESDVNNAYSNTARPRAAGNGVPGIQTGGRDFDGTPDARGISEKIADTVTGDNIDDKTGKPVR